MTTTNDSERRMYGGFWVRTVAFLIDLIILTAMVLLVGGRNLHYPRSFGHKGDGFHTSTAYVVAADSLARATMAVLWFMGVIESTGYTG